MTATPVAQEAAERRATVVVHVNDPGGYDVYIGRSNPSYRLAASKWANPFTVKRLGRIGAIDAYRNHILKTPKLMASLPELRGKRLGCWCKPAACHGDVLAELAATPDLTMMLALPDNVEPCGEGFLEFDSEGRRAIRVDAGIAPAVRALWAGGVKTRASCDGHGADVGYVLVEIPGGAPDVGFTIFTQAEVESLHEPCEAEALRLRRQRNEYYERACRAEEALVSLAAVSTKAVPHDR